MRILSKKAQTNVRIGYDNHNGCPTTIAIAPTRELARAANEHAIFHGRTCKEQAALAVEFLKSQKN